MKKIVKYKNRTFICQVDYQGSNTGKVTIYERKRPKWPIFKDSWCGVSYFFDVDYPTIDAAIVSAIQKVLDDLGDPVALGSKWQQFKDNIDKPISL